MPVSVCPESSPQGRESPANRLEPQSDRRGVPSYLPPPTWSFERLARSRLQRSPTAAPSPRVKRARRGQARANTERQVQQWLLRNQATHPLAPEAQGSTVEGWSPSLVLGSSLGVDLSAVELAERKVAQWNAILDYHKAHLPEAVGQVQEILNTAIEERNRLDDDDENSTKPKSCLASTVEDAISTRLSLLRSALESSQFAPEAANIRVAIQGYAAGTIPYLSNFTLIYVGHIVDTCPSYESFCVDRSERLDRYAEAHGPGWLWYEPPLAGEFGGGVELVKKGFALNNPPSRRAGGCGSGYWEITMGFRRRRDRVSRHGKKPAEGTPSPTGGEHRATVGEVTIGKFDPLGSPNSPPDTVPDPTAPRLFFSMHLDSGATKPTLYTDDFKAMGIDRGSYSAQTVARAQGVWMSAMTRLFEVDVGIYAAPNNDDGTAAVAGPVAPDPPDRVWPAEPDALGATMPVIMLDEPLPPSHRPSDCSRLSGMLPFYAAYLSVAPGTHAIWVGEDRKDVLGAARMPGHMRYSGFRIEGSLPLDHHAAAPGALATGHPVWLARDLKSPDRMVFEHKLGDSLVQDEDLGTGVSIIRLVANKDGRRGDDGEDDDKILGDEESVSKPGKTWRIEPRKQAAQARALKDIKEAKTRTRGNRRASSGLQVSSSVEK